MTATTKTIDRVAALRALATHIKRHDLTEDITTIQFSDSVSRDGLFLHVHTSTTTAAWVRSLGDVSARAFWHGASVHIRIDGTLGAIPVRLLFIATQRVDRDVIAEFRGTLEMTSNWNGEPIELPECLGGAR